MVKLYIYKLFYLLQNPSSNLKKLSSLIMNDNILKEISLQNKYKNKIRKTFGYNIENEKYKNLAIKLIENIKEYESEIEIFYGSVKQKFCVRYWSIKIVYMILYI